jgi:alkyl hydroperoxide reductase subunit AhpC
LSGPIEFARTPGPDSTSSSFHEGRGGEGAFQARSKGNPPPLAVIGERAPDFNVPAYRDGVIFSVHLSRFLGSWVVLCFYPGDFTFVCPTELTDLAVNYDLFRSLDAEVIAISVDSAFVHKAWEEHELRKMAPEGRVPFLMASDLHRDVGRAYGALDEKTGVHFRATYLVDPDGILQAAEILAPSVGRNVREILRRLAAFRHVRETGGAEACPSGWIPGKTTLPLLPALVGKISTAWHPESPLVWPPQP